MIRAAYQTTGSGLIQGCGGNGIDIHIVVFNLCCVKVCIRDVHEQVLVFIGIVIFAQSILHCLFDCIRGNRCHGYLIHTVNFICSLSDKLHKHSLCIIPVGLIVCSRFGSVILDGYDLAIRIYSYGYLCLVTATYEIYAGGFYGCFAFQCVRLRFLFRCSHSSDQVVFISGCRNLQGILLSDRKNGLIV